MDKNLPLKNNLMHSKNALVCPTQKIETINTTGQSYFEVKILPQKQNQHLTDTIVGIKQEKDSKKYYTILTKPVQHLQSKSTAKDKDESISARSVSMAKPHSMLKSNRVAAVDPLKSTKCSSINLQMSSDLKQNISKQSTGNTLKTTLINTNSFSSFEEDGTNQLISPSSRWLSQPRSYGGAKRESPMQRKPIRKLPVFVDTTDGETSGMGSSVDEPIESSTESASEAPSSFLQPRSSYRPPTISPSALKKRRGGWPKGRKRKPELPGTKPPKAPLTAYVLFLNERRKFYKETQAHLPFAEVTKLLGAEWSAMSAEQKSVFVTRSDQDKRRYRNELQSYRQSHDYQILLRKKRMKNAIQRGATTTEESSDFTDEIDDDDSEELYCRTCDQWFSSLHNKREHLYGRHHLQAITGEYQRERNAEEQRAAAATVPTQVDFGETCIQNSITIEEMSPSNKTSINLGESTLLSSEDKGGSDDEFHETEEFSPKYGYSTRRESTGLVSTTEDDHDYYEDDEEREYDGEEEVTEEEGGVDSSDKVSDAVEGVINKVFGRELEIRWLRRRHEKARMCHKKLTASLLSLQSRQRQLQEEQQLLNVEEKALRAKVEKLSIISFVAAESAESEGNLNATVNEKTVCKLSSPVHYKLHLETLMPSPPFGIMKEDPWIKPVSSEYHVRKVGETQVERKPLQVKSKFYKFKTSLALDKGESSNSKVKLPLLPDDVPKSVKHVEHSYDLLSHQYDSFKELNLSPISYKMPKQSWSPINNANSSVLENCNQRETELSGKILETTKACVSDKSEDCLKLCESHLSDHQSVCYPSFLSAPLCDNQDDVIETSSANCFLSNTCLPSCSSSFSISCNEASPSSCTFDEDDDHDSFADQNFSCPVIQEEIYFKQFSLDYDFNLPDENSHSNSIDIPNLSLKDILEEEDFSTMLENST